MQFRLINTLGGCFVFFISLIIYLNTLEQTASFWDCGEFITCAWKLEIGHQPGAPLYLLLGRLFSLFAGEPAQVALLINSMSAFASALSVFFLFQTIVILTRKLFKDDGISSHSRIIITAGAMAGSLACAFSDTFWFSAVEAEVYALSSLFTAVAFWAALKWATSTEEISADRWMILIAYLMGLSIGVHLLNLLVIPALVLVYYFKKKKPSRKGFIIYILFSLAILGFIVFLVIPGVVRIAAWFDLLFVNGLHLPINSGAIVFIILLAVSLFLLIRYTHIHNITVWNKLCIGTAVFLIGYSSYLVLAIRAHANPPINMNKVSNPYSLLQYINREQYISRPLLYGPYFNAPITGIKSKYSYVPEDGKYKLTTISSSYKYDKRYMTVFPRMSSNDPQDITAYKRWTGIKDRKPSFSDNISFFLKYQAGYMYFRYFMWNFAGRQTENQGVGDALNGNWISGIPFLDGLRLGPQKYYPETLKKNKGRNIYFFLPLLVGIAGILYQYKRDRNYFHVVLLFFLLTGLAIVVYLNEIPLTPRERDYATGGSFYVYCIWIGMGVSALYQKAGSLIQKKNLLMAPVFILALLVPLLMVLENYDDHNRKGRFMARDFALDYLDSCDHNAILFTNADNDTYPLWYAQEVEGIRTDVRVVLAPFLNADWYIEKLAEWQNEAMPVKLTIDPKRYASGTLDYVPYYKRINNAVRIDDMLEFLESSHPDAMLRTNDGSQVNYYPTNQIIMPAKGCEPVTFAVSDKALLKHLVVILDIIATNNWEKPVYFLSTQIPSQLGLMDYLQLDGFAYRLIPEKFLASGSINAGKINTGPLYEKLMNQFAWGNMNDPAVFNDFNSIRTTNVLGIRNTFSRLAEDLIRENKRDSAIQVLNRCMEIMPHESVPYDLFTLRIITAYANAGDVQKAGEVSRNYEAVLENERRYYESLRPEQQKALADEQHYNRYAMEQIKNIREQIIR